MRTLVRSLLIVAIGMAATAAFADDDVDNEDESKAIQKIILLGGTVRLSMSLPGNPVTSIRFAGKNADQPGTDASVKFNDKYVRQLKSFSHLSSLSLTNTSITDEGLKELKDLKNLTRLSLAGTTVTDAGMKDIAEIKSLTVLNLRNTTITDDGLKELSELKNLKTLELWGAKTTVEGVKLLNKSLPSTRINMGRDFLEKLYDPLVD